MKKNDWLWYGVAGLLVFGFAWLYGCIYHAMHLQLYGLEELNAPFTNPKH